MYCSSGIKPKPPSCTGRYILSRAIGLRKKEKKSQLAFDAEIRNGFGSAWTSIIRVAGSGSRRPKKTQKKKKVKEFHVLKCWMFSFEG
jgi:hypothetical protein